MAQYDGSIRIGTKIDTKGYESGMKRIEDVTGMSAKEVEKEVVKLGSNISKTADNIASLRSKMDALKDVKLPTDEYKSIQNQIDATEKKIDGLLARQEKFLATGGKESSSTYQRIQYDIDELKASLPYLKGELQDLIDTGKAFTLGSDTEEYAQISAQMRQLNQQMQSDTQRQSELQSALAAEEERLAQIKANATVSNQQIIDLLERRKQLIAEIKDMESQDIGLGYKQYEDANRELEEINGKIKDYKKNLESVPEKFEKMRKSANKAFTAVASGTKKSSGLLSTFSSRLKGIALSLLIFNWISKGFNAMISGMKQGFTNFMNYSDSFANSVQGMKNAMSTLGNQFAAAFAPIIQMIIPWLTKLVSAISTAMTYVAQFIAILGGKSTFTRAKQVQDKYNKSLGGTAAAAKKAYGALAKFDDLDVLQKKEDDAAGGATDAVGDLFEEVPVDSKFKDWLDGILDKLKPILDYFKKLKDIFMEGFWDGLGDWEYRLDIIKNSLASIKKSLIDIFTDPAVLAAANEWTKSVIYLLGSLAGSMASIGLTIAANFLGGLAKYLERNKNRIKGFIISIFEVGTEINQLISEFAQTFAYIFEAFASEDAQQLTANIIGIFTDAVMGTFEVLGKLARDILNIFIQPFVDNKEEFRTALEGFLSVLSEVTGTIKEGIDETFDKLNEVYDEHFKPFFDSVAQGLSNLVGKFLEFWNGNVQPVLKQWAASFDSLWQEHLQPMINSFIELLGQVVDVLLGLWENILQPLIQWVIENILPVILPILDGLIEGFFALIGGISDIVSGIIEVISGVITFLTGVFTLNWKKAWEGIVKIFEGVKDTIKGVINGILGFVESLANGVVNAINTVIRALNALKIDIPDWVPGFGGKSFGFNLSEIPNITIPKLATGAVIRGGNPFMAILGDQPSGVTNIETPLPTMVDAFKQAIAEMGGIGNRESVPVNINLNYDGEAFARLSIPDILSELGRQGYDVDILGVT